MLACTSCYSEIENSYIKCPECNSPYHEDCWKRNGYKCSEYGCNGKLKPSENTETEQSNESKHNTQNLEDNSQNSSGTKNLTQPLDENKSQVNIPIKNNNQTIVFLLVIVIVVLASYIMFKPNNNQPVQQAIATTQPTQTPLYSSNNNSTNSYSNSKPIDSKTMENYNQTQEPTVKPTLEPTVEPTEIYTPTPEPTIDNTSVDKTEDVRQLIKTWRQIKVESFKSLDNSRVYEVLTGKLLEDTLGGINWLKNNNGYRNIEPRSLDFLSIDKLENGNYVAKVRISEINDYYQDGEYRAKNSSDNSYRVNYFISNSDGVLKIFDSEIVK